MRKTKPRYTLISNIQYSLSMHWKTKKSTLIYCAIAIVVGILLPFTGILLPKLVIDEIMRKATPVDFIIHIGGFSALLIVLNYIKSYTDVIVNDSVGTIASCDFTVKAMKKHMTMDYELTEDPGVKVIEDKALDAAASNHTPAHNIPRTLVRLIVNIMGFILYGSVISAIHPLIILLIAISAAIGWICLRAAQKFERSTKEERSLIYRKLHYVQSSIKFPSGAKDIRLYSMAGWIKRLFTSLANESARVQSKVNSRYMISGLVNSFLIFIRDGAAYAFLIYLLLRDELSLGDFVFVFAAIGSFSGWISGIIAQTSELFRASSEMCDIREFMDIPNKSNTGPGVPLPSGTMLPPYITLRNVGYTYPKSETEALRDISVDIRVGEHIAIVGENGAGKTTLVKLICGLYQPKVGSITLGGVNIKEYNRDEYFTLFNTVFQDIHFMTTDIAGNISQVPPELTDYLKVEKSLRLSGLYEKINSLPQKEKTMLVRQVNDDAVELSGGEKQKLVLARALYKDAPVTILDEPTAALDPIAESDIYQKFAEFTKGKTSVYISHRLASTRFCDRILFIDNHTIAEIGTHDELMRLGGKYARMFQIQSHYYRDEEVELDDQAI